MVVYLRHPRSVGPLMKFYPSVPLTVSAVLLAESIQQGNTLGMAVSGGVLGIISATGWVKLALEFRQMKLNDALMDRGLEDLYFREGDRPSAETLKATAGQSRHGLGGGDQSRPHSHRSAMRRR